MTLPPPLTLSYWFDPSPAPFLPMVERGILVVFVAFFFAGILARLIIMRQGWDKMTKKAIRRAASALMVLGFVGLLLYVLSYERVYVLGMRFGYLLWIVLFAWYAYRLIRMVRIDMPLMEQRRAERDNINKWLPKSKA